MSNALDFIQIYYSSFYLVEAIANARKIIHQSRTIDSICTNESIRLEVNGLSKEAKQTEWADLVWAGVRQIVNNNPQQTLADSADWTETELNLLQHETFQKYHRFTNLHIYSFYLI